MRGLEFKSVQEVIKLAATIKSYIKEEIKAEESGQKVEFERRPTRFFRLKGDLFNGEDKDLARTSYQKALDYFKVVADEYGIKEMDLRLKRLVDDMV